jgi:hypothetical protein
MGVHAGYNCLESSPEYYTPPIYIKAVYDVLGWIDLDPASCELANTVVKARRFFTEQDDGLSQSWVNPDGSPSRVFLNPPFGKRAYDKSSQARWSGHLANEYASGRVLEAILLCNPSDTASKWFHNLMRYPHCFTDHRIQFWQVSPTAKTVGRGMAGSIFVYFGKNAEKFYEVFDQFGTCEPPARIRAVPTLF